MRCEGFLKVAVPTRIAYESKRTSTCTGTDDDGGISGNQKYWPSESGINHGETDCW